MNFRLDNLWQSNGLNYSSIINSSGGGSSGIVEAGLITYFDAKNILSYNPNPTAYSQNVAGTDSNIGFFFGAFQSGTFNDVKVGWIVNGNPTWIVTNVNPGAEQITISGGQFLSGVSYSFINGLWADLKSSNPATTTSLPTYTNSEYFAFNGSSNNWKFQNPISTLDFSLGVWFKTNSTVGNNTDPFYLQPSLLGADVAAVANDFGFVIGNGYVGFGAISGQTVFTTLQYNDNNWHYAIGSRKGSTGDMKIYVDAAVASATIIEAPGVILNAPTYIGIGYDTGSNSHFLTGDISNVQVYNRLLSDSEINQNYLVGH